MGIGLGKDPRAAWGQERVRRNRYGVCDHSGHQPTLLRCDVGDADQGARAGSRPVGDGFGALWIAAMADRSIPKARDPGRLAKEVWVCLARTVGRYSQERDLRI